MDFAAFELGNFRAAIVKIWQVRLTAA